MYYYCPGLDLRSMVRWKYGWFNMWEVYEDMFKLTKKKKKKKIPFLLFFYDFY